MVSSCFPSVCRRHARGLLPPAMPTYVKMYRVTIGDKPMGKYIYNIYTQTCSNSPDRSQQTNVQNNNNTNAKQH